MVEQTGPRLPEPTESALVIRVPAADPSIGRYRLQFDSSAVEGVPAHVTILYPFVLPDALTETMIERLSSVIIRVPRFIGRWARTAWFGDQVLWLAPEPEESFNALIRGVMAAFPDYPPYGGEYGDPTPHLTIADHGTRDELRALERVVQALLPIEMAVSSVQLICGSDAEGSWRTVRSFPLG